MFKEMTVDEYRKKHKRCKTCQHAHKQVSGWICEAKGSWYEWSPGAYTLKGCFCQLYKPKAYYNQ